MGVNTTHDAHVKRWGQRHVAKSPFVALFYRNRFFEAAPGPHRATRGWIEDRKAKWNPMVPTTQQTRYCNQYMLSICIIYIYIFVHMYLWHHMCMLWLLCPKTLDSLLPLGVATWRAGGGYKFIARLEHFYNLLTKCCNLPYKWC